MPTPCFPLWRAPLAALGRRSLQRLRQATLAQLDEHLRSLIPPGLLAAEDEGLNSRERVFSLCLTCECFLWQLLHLPTACREGVRQVPALCRLRGRRPPDDTPSAYVPARKRLPHERLERRLDATAQAADCRAGEVGHLGGRPVKVVEGSSVQLPDTPENQKEYPPPSRQKRGCGFPVMHLVVVFSLAAGAVLEVAMDNLHQHELRLFALLWETFRAGDILLGDRGFGDYVRLARLPWQGVDVVTRLHARRKVDFCKARRLGTHDRSFVWRKGSRQSDILSAEAWRTLPAEITVRILRCAVDNRRGRPQLWEDLLFNLVEDAVPERPGRNEPRAVKRRPKTVPSVKPASPKIQRGVPSQPLLEKQPPQKIKVLTEASILGRFFLLVARKRLICWGCPGQGLHYTSSPLTAPASASRSTAVAVGRASSAPAGSIATALPGAAAYSG